MKVRNRAKIGTSFPYSPVEIDEEVVLQSGKEVAAAIAEIMSRLGAEVSEPDDVEEYGWELDVSYKGRNPWCLVQHGGDYLYLDMKDRRGAWFNDDPRYIEF